MQLDVLILGSGVAGLSAAVRLAEVPGLEVGVLTKAELAQSTTRWAQGGVAAVLGGDEDSTDLHLADTLAAGAGLCDVGAVRVLVDEGPARVTELISLGAVFDREAGGSLARAREGGHSTARVLHAGGLATGAEVERALVSAVRSSATAVLEEWFALDLVVEAQRCVGVMALDPDGICRQVRARHVVLATGGAGQLYSVTTNPSEATGDGMAMALRAGVAVCDIEFFQFHPTALHHPAMPRPLLSEALRGHGALLRDARGERFVEELASRDVVSRAMAEKMADDGVEHLWLDATGLESFDNRFPTLAQSLRAADLDPAVDWLPIVPAAHYLSGGIVTDLDGATTLDGLWAVGEVACTGVHGANRLASNSLLEGMVFGARMAEAIEAGHSGARPTGIMDALLRSGPTAQSVVAPDIACVDIDVVSTMRAPDRLGGPGRLGEAAGGAVDAPTVADVAKQRDRLQRAMTAGAGVVRSASSIGSVVTEVSDAAVMAAAASRSSAGPDASEPSVEMRRAAGELANLAVLAGVLLESAAARQETRGAHARSDHPALSPQWRRRIVHRRPRS